MDPIEQLTPAEYWRLYELACSQRSPMEWQEIKLKLAALSEGQRSLASGSLDTSKTAGTSLPSNIPSKEKPE